MLQINLATIDFLLVKISYYGVGDFWEFISLSEEHGNSKFNTSQSLNTTYSKIQLSGIVGRNYYNLQVLTEKSGNTLGGGGGGVRRDSF